MPLPLSCHAPDREGLTAQEGGGPTHQSSHDPAHDTIQLGHDKKDAPEGRLPALECFVGLTYITYYTPDSGHNSSEILLFSFCFLPGVFHNSHLYLNF
jgi:hypothetical protein